MAPPDSTLVDQALLALLGGDATLLSYVPNGVYWDEAPPTSSAFVIVHLLDHRDDPIFGGRKFENGLYLVKAVILSSEANAAANIKAAAARIDVLLEDATLTATGFTTLEIAREGRVRITEVDDLDPTIRWYHRGGNYRVQMTVT